MTVAGGKLLASSGEVLMTVTRAGAGLVVRVGKRVWAITKQLAVAIYELAQKAITQFLRNLGDDVVKFARGLDMSADALRRLVGTLTPEEALAAAVATAARTKQGGRFSMEEYARNAVAAMAKRGDPASLKAISKLDDKSQQEMLEQLSRAASKSEAEDILNVYLDSLRPRKGWKSTQKWDTGANSTLLRSNMGLTDPHFDAHHIVPSTSSHADPSRKLLDRYQIDINARENGIPLLNQKGIDARKPGRPHHGEGLHAYRDEDAAIRRVNARLKSAVERIDDWATARQALVSELATIRDEILTYKFP